MKKIYAIFFLAVVLVSCTRLNYLGSSFPPSKNVDVYVDPASIARPYKVVGRGFFESKFHSLKGIEKMQALAIAKAKQKGADAILFDSYHIIQDGAKLHSLSTTDSIGKGVVTTRHTAIGPIVSSGTDVLFLKYE
jgi:hypothetical protein